MFWISISGTQIEAEDYAYTIKIMNSAERRTKEMYPFTGKRGCVSCEVSHEDMMKSGNAVFLNKVMLESAANENDGKSLKFECCLVIDETDLPSLTFVPDYQIFKSSTS